MLGHPRLAGPALAVYCVCVLACGTHSGAGGAGAPCQTIGPAPTSHLPHLTVTGANATAIVQALDAIFSSQTPPVSPGKAYSLTSLACSDIAVPGAAAGIDDCDPTRNLFIVCNTLGGAPACGHEWTGLATVGESELVPICGPNATSPEPPFDAATSLVIWNAIVKAAADAAFHPSNGVIAQTTVINADYFTWDSTTLAFSLVADDPTPPPSVSGPAADGG
jgi:hypothetical protein